MRPSRLITLGEPGLGLDPASFGVVIETADAPGPSDAVTASWDALRAAKPRLFNGPILSFLGVDCDERGAVVRAARDWYSRLTVQSVEPGLIVPPVMQLSVTGVVTARDLDGAWHVLLGRRSEATRIYGSMWELAPSGGVDPPPMSVGSIDGFDVFRQLMTEVDEELGLPANPDPGRILALTIDEHAWSCDIVMRIELVRPVEDIVAHTDPGAGHGWEYTATRWVPLELLPEFVGTHPCIPPTVALAPLVGALSA